MLFPSPGHLPNPGIEPGSAELQADTLPPEAPGTPWTMYKRSINLLCGLTLSVSVLKKTTEDDPILGLVAFNDQVALLRHMFQEEMRELEVDYQLFEWLL